MAIKSPDVTDVGRKCEIRALEQRISKKGEVEVVVRSDYQISDVDPDTAYCLVVKRVFKKDGTLNKVLLTINSPQLLATLKRICGDYHSHPCTFDLPVQMQGPFTDLYHYWDELEEYHMNTEDDVTRMHLSLLISFMRHEMGHERAEVSDMVSKGVITFLKLWTLFKPGEVMFTSERGHPWLLKLEKTAYEESSKTGRRFEVHCTHTVQDGARLAQYRKKIDIFEKQTLAGDTPCPINALPVRPFRFVPDACVQSELEQRGEECEQILGVLNVYHDGMAEYQRTPPSDFFHPQMASWELAWLPFTETGRVVIDPKTFLEEYGKAREDLIPHTTREFQTWATATYGSLLRANRILCAPYIWGYSLQKKEWCKFYVRNIKPVEWNANLIQSLVLPEKRKDLLRALVTSHKVKATHAREESSQKGKGLIILLHGTPGSGKTLSAEVSAEISCSALLKISLGELDGVRGFEEERLKNFFKYATIWRAIVLIDEADVFLEARASGGGESAKRNALVATFLRYLEYFAGIVFLTSNRVQDFDPAMKSRIHLALQFSPPTQETRRKIWHQQLLEVSAENRDVELYADGTETFLDKLAREEMNGREIANSIYTALTLARFSEQKLNPGHLKSVVDAWREFSDTLAQIELERHGKLCESTMVASSTKARWNL